ncbi:endonuclease III [Puia sp.]|jgi:endonuclease-3|uniref:endonuclease III domain-containing protein n=1 Tax=Puia sp. TaxID=2045100 RepID=UPI002F4140F8
MRAKIDWPEAIRPLVKKYKGKKHPLEYGNVYQLIVMVVLSARSTDSYINSVAPKFFADFPDITSLDGVAPAALFPYFAGITNFANKAKWLTAIAGEIKTNDHIPLSLEQLTHLPGIGRKSANVILREAGAPPEGIIVDVHVLRVAPRLGIVKTLDAGKMEEQLMKILPAKEWDAGMAMSFHGREICSPKPKCDSCLMNKVCLYYSRLKK